MDAIKDGKGRFYGLGTVSQKPRYYLAQRVDQGERPLGVVVVKVDLGDLDARWDENQDTMPDMPELHRLLRKFSRFPRPEDFQNVLTSRKLSDSIFILAPLNCSAASCVAQTVDDVASIISTGP